MKTVDAGDVLDTFYRLREQHFRIPIPQFRAQSHSAKQVALAQRFLAWCKAEEITDVPGYMRHRIEAGAHAGHPVGLAQLPSARMAELWREWREGEHLEQQRAEKLARAAGTRAEQAVKELRVLTRGMEAAKHPYVTTGRHELCLAEIEYTGGFHPASRACTACPIGVRCAAKLYQQHGFDVVSLRAGRLHVLPREIAAAAVR